LPKVVIIGGLSSIDHLHHHALQVGQAEKTYFCAIIAAMVGINEVSVHFSGEPLFDDISFIINPRDRIGLVGKNGSGKTTLLRIIAGEFEPESGNVSRPNYLTTGLLPQEMVLTGKGSVMEETLTAYDEAIALEKKISLMEQQIASRHDFHAPAYLKLVAAHHEAVERFHLIGGHTRQADAEKVLTGLGFEQEELDRDLKTFSGGWQMRVELAKILLRKPDLLLLDEPTNHLDIESIQWMESFLEDYPGAVVLVSHDRAFLDRITTRTIEIALGEIHDYRMSFSEYVVQREAELEQQQAAFSNQQRQIAQIERFIERFRYKNTKARQVQSRLKLLEKIDRVQVDEIDRSAIHFQFPPAPHSGKVVVEARAVSKSFGSKLVLKDLDFQVIQGDFIAFVGKNGMGKTTLVKIITGELPCEGELKLGHQVSLSYFAQNQAEMLDGDKTVFETIDEVAVGDIRPRIRNILGSFLFSGDSIDKKVKVLSGGEKSRLALARLLLTPANLLVLDEPTNHLDMASKDILKNALLQYKGTLILVSHDRDFLQGLTQKVFEFRQHRIRQHLGDIYDFLEARKLQDLHELNRKKQAQTAGQSSPVSENKELYIKKKQQSREIRKIENQIEKCEEEIAAYEKRLGEIRQMLADPAAFAGELNDTFVFEEFGKVQAQLDDAMHRWETLHALLEDNGG